MMIGQPSPTLPAPRPRYQVEHYTLCDGWTNTWTLDDAPQTFDSYADAERELNLFLAEIVEEIRSGDRAPDEGYAHDEFRIVAVTAPTITPFAWLREVDVPPTIPPKTGRPRCYEQMHKVRFEWWTTSMDELGRIVHRGPYASGFAARQFVASLTQREAALA